MYTELTYNVFVGDYNPPETDKSCNNFGLQQ